MNLRLHPYTLPLLHPWSNAGGTLTERRGLLVQVERDGLAGWGDCAPLPGRTEDLAAAIKALRAETPSPASAPLRHPLPPPRFARNLRNAGEAGAGEGGPRRRRGGEGTPAARCAIDTARLDWAARHAGLPLARLLCHEAADSVPVNAALGPLDDGCLGRARDAVAAGFAVAKVKVGVTDPASEARHLGKLADLPLRLRLDANRAWDEQTAAAFLSAVAGLPVDSIEEPLADPTPSALGRLQAKTAIPLAVDESLQRLGLAAVVACGVRRVVLKPMELGGPSFTFHLAQRAKEAGLEVVVTSALESAIGVVACAHLAAALGDGPAHGLATLGWLAGDTAPRPRISGGRLYLPGGPGLGIVPFGQSA